VSLGIKDLLRRWSLFALTPKENHEHRKEETLTPDGHRLCPSDRFLGHRLAERHDRPSSVVATKVGAAPGTLPTTYLLEVRSVPAGGVPSDAFKAIADVEGQIPIA